MANTDHVGNSSALANIDIAKDRNEILIQRSDRKRYRVSMIIDRTARDRLVRHLHDIEGDLDIAFEPTGNYHRTST